MQFYNGTDKTKREVGAELLAAANRAHGKGELTKGDYRKIRRTSRWRPFAWRRVVKACCEELCDEGLCNFEESTDRYTLAAAVDWDAIADFLERILPLILQFIEQLIPLFSEHKD